MFHLFALVLGAIFGSFINALSFRYGTGVGMNGRSRCMRCNHTLSAADLVPLLSFAFSRGRCRYCSSRISPQYALVEMTGAILLLGVSFVTAIPSLFVWYGAWWMILLFTLVYDIRHTVLPQSALVLSGVMGFASVFLFCTSLSCYFAVPSGLDLNLLAGPIVALPLLLISAVSRGRAMGWGDGLLMLGIGYMLGIGGGVTALCIAFWSGAIVGLSLVAFARISDAMRPLRMADAARRVTMKSEIPFAPFLIFGAAVVFFFHVDIFSAIL